jgi:hypothetical protein
MQRTGHQKRIWEVGGLIALVALVAVSTAFAVRGQLLNRALGTSIDNADIQRMMGLIRDGADVNLRSPDYTWTPLMQTASEPESGLVDELLHRGARVNESSRSGTTALMFACGRGSLRTVKLLLAHGADPHQKDKLHQTALTFAVQNWDVQKVKVLLQLGCDPCDRDLDGQTGFDIALGFNESHDRARVRLLRQLDRSLHSSQISTDSTSRPRR